MSKSELVFERAYSVYCKTEKVDRSMDEQQMHFGVCHQTALRYRPRRVTIEKLKFKKTILMLSNINKQVRVTQSNLQWMQAPSRVVITRKNQDSHRSHCHLKEAVAVCRDDGNAVTPLRPSC